MVISKKELITSGVYSYKSFGFDKKQYQNYSEFLGSNRKIVGGII